MTKKIEGKTHNYHQADSWIRIRQWQQTSTCHSNGSSFASVELEREHANHLWRVLACVVQRHLIIAINETNDCVRGSIWLCVCASTSSLLCSYGLCCHRPPQWSHKWTPNRISTCTYKRHIYAHMNRCLDLKLVLKQHERTYLSLLQIGDGFIEHAWHLTMWYVYLFICRRMNGSESLIISIYI